MINYLTSPPMCDPDGWFGSVKYFQAIAIFGGFLVVFFIVMHFVNKKLAFDKKRLVLKIIACSMIFLEFVKFINILRNGGDGLGKIGSGEFPFLLCSMPLYLFPMVAFSKGKLGDFVAPAAFIIGAIAGGISLAYPAAILKVCEPWFYPDRLSFSIISLPFHTIMVVFAGYMVQSKVYRLKAGDWWKALSLMFSLAAIAIVLNALIPGADFFMLGPGVGNPISALIPVIGHAGYVAVMLIVGALVVGLVYAYWIIRWFIDRYRYKKYQNDPQ